MARCLVCQPNRTPRLGDVLNEHLQNRQWTAFRAAVAFAKRSGVRHLERAVADFAARGTVRVTVGVDFGGTSREGLRALFRCVAPRGEVWVFHNDSGSTFHPKVYLFRNDREAHLIIGSGNLTEGGLYTNYETSLQVHLRLAAPDEARLLRDVEAMLDGWASPLLGTAVLLTEDVLSQLEQGGYLPLEVHTRHTEEIGVPGDGATSGVSGGTSAQGPVFRRVPVPPPPRLSNPPPATAQHPATATGQPAPVRSTDLKVFFMTLQRTDVGYGQTTAGTSRRSPEVFIPLAARDYAPKFWGWPNMFVPDPSNPNKRDRTGVRMLVGSDVAGVNMMYWPKKHDLRLRSEALRSAANIGDILCLEKADRSMDYDYRVTIVTAGSRRYATVKARCVNAVKYSQKKWGYA